ncbi:MAG: C10 family peptidase [Bacteroidetes bacterium]|nr:C10 family peptidase [Bacteroidota bacterium]
MIKRFFFITIILFLSAATICFAEHVKKSDAERVAINWFFKIQSTQLKKTKTILIQNCFEIKENEETILYIFSMEPRGYVIVAGDDLSTPILGYSLKSNINPENFPPALETILTSFKEQILEARKQGLRVDQKSQDMWNKLLEPHEIFKIESQVDSRTDTSEVLPLLSTTWDQVWPYNKMCPADPAGPGGRTVTGCVATALAQIMKFYNYPTTGFGSYGYYHSIYGYQFADFGSTTYDWSNMPDVLDSTASEIQQNAVAQLIYHCGVVVQMDYGTDGSGAQLGSLPFSLFQNFNYSHPILINQQMYPLDSLPAIFIQELEENRPVYYAAGSTINGLRHALVCDGYQGEDFFHFNFGWGGNADGYFYLNGVSPTLIFTDNYEAIINIQPDDGLNVRADTTWNGSLTVNRRIGVRSDATLTIEPGTTLEFGKYGGLIVYGNIQAIGANENPIVFTAQDTTVGWNGIELNNAIATAANQDSSRFVNCEIKYAKASYTSTTSMCGVYYWVTPALRITSYSKLLIDSCQIFKSEGAYRGGGIDLFYSSSRISNSLITRNKSIWGSAILISGATPIIENNIISYNSSDSHMGAIVCETYANPIIKNNKIIFNSSGYLSSAFYIYYDSSPTIVNNLIANNFFTFGPFPNPEFGAIYCASSSSMIINNTILNNEGTGVVSQGRVDLTIINNIIWGNTDASIMVRDAGSNLNITFCDIQGGHEGIYIVDPDASIITYENNISTDPGFIGENNFQLSDSSSCVNQGTPDLYGLLIPDNDLSGNPRIFGGRIDMGAYENQNLVAADDLFLAPSKIDFISNVSEIDSVMVRVIYINNAEIDSLGGLSPPFGSTLSNDSSLIKITIYSPVVGEFNDTLIVFSTVGPKQIPITAWVGTVGSGEVSGIWDTTLVKVKGDIIIPNGETLQIYPGTKVEFLGHFKVDVKGRLLAVGDSSELITFTPANKPIGWKGIRFDGTSSTNDTSIIQYCTLENGVNSGINLEGNGGALYVSGFSKLILSNCLIQNNNASGYSGGGVMLTNGANILIRNCKIMNNIAQDGGAIYIKTSSPKIIGNHITSNQANDGGGIDINYGSSPLITNNLISDNHGAWGGGFHIWAESDPLLFNNTIVNNTALDGGGFRIANTSDPSLINNVIYGNKVLIDPWINTIKNYIQIYLRTNADPDFYNNNIQGGLDSIFVEGGYTLYGVYQDNLDANPKFMKFGSHDYYISSSSPCVNAGKQDIGVIDLETSFDLAGNPRIYGGIIDIGAYEYSCIAITTPTVTTTAVSDIGQTTATSGGDVIDDGCATVTARGICWSTLENPTVDGNHTTDGNGTGVFVSNLTGLTLSTLYYVRAYATNSVGTAYGNEISFVAITTPTVTTTAVSDIGQTTATSGGDVINDGCATVTARGVCWSTSQNPTVEGNHTTDGNGTGVFVSNLTGLTPDTLYYVRAYATNSVGTAYGNEISFSTSNCIAITIPTVTTTAVSNIGQTTVTSGGYIINDGCAIITARGVCWSTLQNPTVEGSHTIDGNGSGVFVSNLTDLTLSTLYYVRAYATNSVGTAYGNEVNFLTLSSCGFITINHVADTVAPVTKTVTYGTVANIAGEPSKCWITSNLGANQQATAVNDATEASAGWYWQFNRKQGYKHDGTNRTPNNVWITPINENLDWQAANDPCTLELGSEWRIPTSTEWTNVDASGNWADWNDPWNSGLKLHAAGALHYIDGSPAGRGWNGFYWSSAQGYDNYGECLVFQSGGSYIVNNHKAFGFSLRCLKDTCILPFEQVINIQSGWSGISSYVDAVNDSVTVLFEPILSDLTILMGMSQVYWPGQGINTIGTWDTHQGYKIKVDNEVQLTFSGVLVNDRVVELPTGWSITPVLNNDQVLADDIFGPLADTLTIVKEIGGGEVYWPAQQIFTLQYLIPGKAYCIHVSYPCSIEYPEYSQTRSGVVPDEQFDDITPWNDVWSTPNSHTIAIDKSLLRQCKPGDVIGVFNNSGLCCGMISLGDLQSNTAITAFGDDNTTGITDGFVEDEIMSFKLYRPGTLEEFQVFVTYDQLLPDKEFFTTNGLSKIAGINLVPTSSDLSGIEDCLTIYPNPTGGIIYLTNHCLLGEVDIKIYNDHGQLVMDDHISYTTLHKTFQLDLTGLRKGVYVVKLTGTDFAGFKKVVKF